MKVQKVERTEWPRSVHTLKLKVVVADPVSTMPMGVDIELMVSGHNISDRDLAHPFFTKLAGIVEAALAEEGEAESAMFERKAVVAYLRHCYPGGSLGDAIESGRHHEVYADIPVDEITPPLGQG